MNHNVGAPGLEEKRDAIVARTLRWWDRARRSLAWRAEPGASPDPYKVWLSEVLLQQTTAQAATPYYRAFVETWPTVEDLAAAPIESVISAFAGLGYYSRARNLHACAQEIAGRGGRFPADEAALRALPGVGPYTAAAIAAIAFDRQAAPVDGNIARILARLIGLESADRRFAEGDRSSGSRAQPPASRRRLCPGADGHRRNALPAPRAGLRGLSAEPGLRRVPLRGAGNLSAQDCGEGEAAANRRGLLRSPGRWGLPRPAAAAERPARIDRRASGHAVDGGRSGRSVGGRGAGRRAMAPSARRGGVRSSPISR